MKFGTDKIAHGYLPSYLRIASQIGNRGRVVEVGVDLGASLEMWQALFPLGLVVGVDRNGSARWPRGTVKVVSDQDADDLPARLASAVAVAAAFDLIVDDASHDGTLSRRTWELLWPLVAPGGWYVLEDWQVGLDGWPTFDASMLETVRSFLPELTKDSDVESVECRYGLAILRKRG